MAKLKTSKKMKPRIVQFGDVVAEVNESERNPLENGLDRYLGLDHIEPDCLFVERWGSLDDDDVSFTKRFRKGQVLFVKRRAYQRKSAVAEFDGICSGDILTFKPRGDELIPELLPFIVQSNGFLDHALGTSSGSLSPRTRWSQLRDFQFVLPTKDRQKQIAEVFWAHEEHLRAVRKVLRDIKVFRELLTTHLLGCGTKSEKPIKTACGKVPKSWQIVEMQDIISLTREPVQVAPQEFYHEIGVRSYGKGIFDKEAITGAGIGNKRVFHLEPERLTMNIIFAWEGAIAITRPNHKGMIASHRFPLYRPIRNDVSLDFLLLYLLSPDGLRAIGAASPGGAGRNRTLGQQAFLKIKVPLPPISEQNSIVHLIATCDETTIQMDLALKSSLDMKYRLIQNFIAGEPRDV